MEFLDTFSKCPLVAILRGVTSREVVPLGEALVNQGFTVITVSLNSPDPFSSIALLSEAFAGRVLIGVSEVTEPNQLVQLSHLGGRLVCLSHTNLKLIHRCKEEGLICIPGFFTVTEAFMALEAGADALNLFPAPAPSLLKSLKEALPADTIILPSGGINLDSMLHYLRAGANGFGLGRNLYQPGDSPEAVGQKGREFYALVR